MEDIKAKEAAYLRKINEKIQHLKLLQQLTTPDANRTPSEELMAKENLNSLLNMRLNRYATSCAWHRINAPLETHTHTHTHTHENERASSSAIAQSEISLAARMMQLVGGLLATSVSPRDRQASRQVRTGTGAPAAARSGSRVVTTVSVSCADRDVGRHRGIRDCQDRDRPTQTTQRHRGPSLVC